MKNANTAEGLGYLFAVFKAFPVLQVQLAAFIVYLLVRSVFTYRSARPILSGQHFLDGTLVYHSTTTDRKGREYISTNIRVGNEFFDFGTREKQYSQLPKYREGDPVRIYVAPSMPDIKFLWVPTRKELVSRIFSNYVFRPVMAFVLAVIVFWMFPLMFFMN